MDFKGLSTEIMFFKDFQEKSGLKWKSFATEVQKCCIFLENKMSDANREHHSIVKLCLEFYHC
jgi:protease-4